MNIALIGYGEVGRILGEDLRAAGQTVTAFDLELDAAEGDRGERMRAHASAHGVTLAGSHAGAVRSAELVISAVTASQTIAAAESCAAALPTGSFFLDFNSASPGAKLVAAELVARGAGRYVEGAVMTAVPPHRIKVPLLLGGPDAAALVPRLLELGFAAKLASARLGVASATKMCRSVIIKGLEAMTVESLTAARHYGVEDAVLASLRETFPGLDWEKQAAYFFQRVIEHGRRRGEELIEATVTVEEVGIPPGSAAGTAVRQTWVADLADGGVFGERGSPGFARSADWRVEADRILDHLRTGRAR
jgi:3-hydroxyisobutyrate dehydrogenase-like beta-hydroxyacid dehydrogenase